ncbi:MAG: MXAN_5187 C-terminal domain-containing protein [Candidatus Alcyoniella australis]|nr:MXAN_5187 C-terminal domain-containing protein [Candidatus Alcyoniella australis]
MNNEQQISEFESKMRELTVLYEHYFSGLNKREPFSERQQLQKLVLHFSGRRPNNTQLAFRLSALLSRYEAISRFWDRTMLEIEKGTYKRDRFKADIRIGRLDDIKHGGPRKPLGSEALERVQSTAHRSEQAGQAEREGRELRKLYREFVEARRSTREQTQIDFKKFSKTVRTQRKNLQQRLGGDVGFRVVVEEGKTKLKAAKRKG